MQGVLESVLHERGVAKQVLPELEERLVMKECSQKALVDVEIYFPVKCCPLPIAMMTLHGLGCSFEYASVAEIQRARDLDVLTARGIFGAPARAVADSAAALDMGVGTFVVDSIDEAEKLATLGPGIDVLIRLEVESADTTMPLSTKFGVTSSGNRDLTLAISDLGLRLSGFVFHVGLRLDPPNHGPALLRLRATPGRLRGGQVWRSTRSTSEVASRLHIAGRQWRRSRRSQRRFGAP